MVSDYRSIFFKNMTQKIHKFINYDLTQGRIQKQKFAYTENEIKVFLNNNKENIQQAIHDIVTEYEIDVCSKEEHIIDDDCIKAILYEYIFYEE